MKRKSCNSFIIRYCVGKDFYFLLAIMVGVVLRVRMIEIQVPADDEWHALNILASTDYFYIFTHFGDMDHCIPLALFYKKIAGTFGLDEIIFRMPQLIFGVSLIIVLPLMARSYIGRLAGDFLAYLLALSPMLIYYSRYARPYSIAVFLSCFGILSFFRWYKGGGTGWVIGYGVCAVLATWFLLPVAPFVSCPLLYAFISTGKVSGQPLERDRKSIVIVGICVLVGLSFVLLPPIIVDSVSISGKAGNGMLGFGTFFRIIRLYSGFSQPFLTVIWMAGVFIGLFLLRRMQNDFVRYLLFLVCIQFAAVTLSGASQLSFAIVGARYSLSVLPLLLLFLSILLAKIAKSGAQKLSFPLSKGFVTALIVLASLFGPIPMVYSETNSWTNHGLYQYYPEFENNWHYMRIVPRGISNFYHRLSKYQSSSLTLMEVPFIYFWHQNNLPFYQRIHHQKIVAGVIKRYPRDQNASFLSRDQGIYFKTLKDVTDPDVLVGIEAEYLIVHKDPANEGLKKASWGVWDYQKWSEKCRLLFGPPVFEDLDILVFQLK